MANKYVSLSSGQLAEVEGLTSSAGAGDAGKIPALDAAGRIDLTMMPVGVAAEVKEATAAEALSAGELVNIYLDDTLKCRLADASNGRRAHGFVKDAFESSATATIYLEGTITGKSGLTPGAPQYLSGASAGAVTETAPSTSSYIVQEVGVAISATEISFEPQQPITLA